MYVPTGKVDKRTSEKMEQYYLFVCVDCVGDEPAYPHHIDIINAGDLCR